MFEPVRARAVRFIARIDDDLEIAASRFVLRKPSATVSWLSGIVLMEPEDPPHSDLIHCRTSNRIAQTGRLVA